jgi:hypothetical protein
MLFFMSFSLLFEFLAISYQLTAFFLYLKQYVCRRLLHGGSSAGVAQTAPSGQTAALADSGWINT